jgi:hypothetical protein
LASAELLTVSSLTVGSFVATNLDNLLILVMLQGSTGRSGPLLAGFLTAHIVVMLVGHCGPWSSPASLSESIRRYDRLWHLAAGF